MHLPGQGKVRGIDTEVLGDNVKKKGAVRYFTYIYLKACVLFSCNSIAMRDLFNVCIHLTV